MGLLAGKVALITGGARGQGRAHAVTCAREGADVILADVPGPLPSVPYPLSTSEDLAETVALVEALDQRAIAIEGDVRSQATMDQAVAAGIAEFGKVDILIANAGIWSAGRFWELSEQTWEEMLGIQLTAVWKAAKAVAPHMIERQSGSIVITSSVYGLQPGVHYSHYVAAKHGGLGLMKNMALELAPYGVRCNAICPGAIDTAMADHQGIWDMAAGHEGGTKADMVQGGYHFSALRGMSLLPPEVVANAALYLNSDLAAAVTGVTIPVDAGHVLLDGVNLAPVR